ncbi:AraC family transcriptional regulator [Staphylococcus shinii]|uniref:AraC family transcriptional regulator n=1 Tax=Staphylococcus shinii TaxID=2912228 RepID=UPI00298EEF19|nr:AraC family transcriptional regulator [Staphylococcus shinii]MDW8574120.1 AraC family transcriptional regulator [Staphylococcus shinii]
MEVDEKIDYNAYGFRFKGDYQYNVAGLSAIGFELIQSSSYRWHGLHRGEKDVYIFQYTTRGYGAISIDEKIYQLAKDDAFFVRVPSNHCYYLPNHSSEWEFVYFTIYGEEVSRLFNRIVSTHGNILKFPINSEPITHIIETLQKIDAVGIKHGYESSSCAYTFMMKCLEYLEYGLQKSNNYPLPTVKAINFIENHYQQDITLDDIVAVTGLSKYHFSRQFHKVVNDTPINFLTKIRIKNSLILLTKSSQSIESIAYEVGYASSNYFSKVFKKIVGITPNNYRKNTTIMPVDKLFID